MKSYSICSSPRPTPRSPRRTTTSLYHRTDARTLEAVADAASRGLLTIPIAKTFPLDQIGAAQSAVAACIQGKVVLKH
jgi:NADPH:quinone reductase-like Zn-dependent oxidoreductase